ncbi:MAG: 16S rRNA (guanine(527)-N(7))-methyltransferase RsmG [Clostridiales bacterium]|nr:16S rRNA (guanine(527)-N(7))-methyltransferase RsmG [Clostridiales bacterium]
MTDGVLGSVMPELTEEQIRNFIKYYNLLLEWNARVNLTRIVEPMEVAKKHFADSILGSRLIPEGARVVDVGTGAGFPGVPLKIVRPDIELCLVDSLGKRVKFLNELCAALGIRAEAIHARAEDAARLPALREKFDIALSRAVAPMNVLTELTVPFVKVGGASLMYKAASTAEEMAASANAFRELRCRAEAVEFDVPWGARTIVRVVKNAPTPAKYPRKAGTPEKSPL